MSYAGGIRKEDILVADVEELENLEASENHARRLDAKEVLMPNRGENFKFRVADGTVELAGRDPASRRSISSQDHPARDEEHNDVPQGESDGSDTEAQHDIWSTSEKSHFIVIALNQELNSMCQVKGHSPKNNSNTLMLPGGRIGHVMRCWKVALTKICRAIDRFSPTVVNKRPPNGYTWSKGG